MPDDILNPIPGVVDFPAPGWAGSSVPEWRHPPPVQLGRLWMPATFENVVMEGDGRNPEWALTLMYAVEDHEVVLASALAGGDDLPSLLKRVTAIQPLSWWARRTLRCVAADYANEAAEQIFSDDEIGLEPTAEQVAVLEVIGSQRDAYVKDQLRAATVTPVTRRRNRITPEFLAEVAKVYRDALKAGKPPTRAVAEHFCSPHSTAADWVLRARKQGVLGKSDSTRGGELTHDRTEPPEMEL